MKRRPRLTLNREKTVLEDKISLILGEKPRHTAVCLRFSSASQKNFLSYKTASHLKTGNFFARMCPERAAILTYCKLCGCIMAGKEPFLKRFIPIEVQPSSNICLCIL